MDDAYRPLDDAEQETSDSKRRIEPKRIALVVVVLFSDLLLAGIIWGWAPLLLMLQEEQQYIELCDVSGSSAKEEERLVQAESGSPLGCDAQENKLNLMFAVGSVVINAVALPVGFFLDRAGPKIAVAVAGVFEVAGLVLLAFADSQTFDVFVVAYSLLAIGGIMTLMASFPASFLIMQHQTVILAAINCLMDGSSVVFLVLYYIKKHSDLTRQHLLSGMAVLAAANYIALVALWHVNEHALAGVASTEESISMTSSENEHRNSGEIAPTFHPVVDYDSAAVNGSEHHHERVEDDEDQLVDVPIRKQLRTLEFAYILVFAAVQGLRTTVYIGTTNILLENYGDRDHDFLYTKIFSIVLPLGFLFVPVINHIVDQRGLVFSLFFTNGLGVVYNSLALIRNLYLQCVTFFLFAGFRVLLFTVLSCFTAKTFGLLNMGSLMGIIFSIGAIVNLLEYPAVYVSNAYFNGDLSMVYGITLVLCGLLFPYTEYLRRHWLSKSQKQQQLRRPSV